MTRVIEVPATFDDRSFEQFAAGVRPWPPEEKILLDARGAQWASPYGLLAMLTAGQALAEARRERPLFTVPTSDDVKRYWARAGFFKLRRRAVRAARQSAEGDRRRGRRTCCST